MSDKRKILFVCLGNICRSPLAEELFRAHVVSQGLADRVIVDSAGTSDWHVGQPPHEGSIIAGHRLNVDLNGQKYRQFVKEDFVEFDLILGMDRENVQAIYDIRGETKPISTTNEAQIDLFMNYAEPENVQSEIDVPDPWGKADIEYDKVAEMIEAACPVILEKFNS